MINRNKQQSFTLIELLVVIVIIGILAGVIMISTSSSIDKANFAKAQTFSNTVQEELLLNLVSEWTFNNTSNPTEDSWGKNHGILAGTLPPDPEYQNPNNKICISGGCYKFNNSSANYIECGYSPNFKNGITASVWIKLNDITNLAHIFSRYGQSGQQFSLYQVDNGLVWYINGGGSANRLNGYSVFTLNKWFYLVGTFSNSSKKQEIFVNGISINKRNYDVTLNNPTEKTVIGNCVWHDTIFDGYIDDARVYDAALSVSQIKQNYIAGLNSLLANGNICKKEYNERINSLSTINY